MPELNSPIIIPITPCPAPRMVRSDKWKTPNHIDPRKRQRLCVTKYFEFRRSFLWLCKKHGYYLKDTLNIVFVLPMPNSWSRAKKEKMLNKPHQSKPDVDNCVKAVIDSFGIDDSFVWRIQAEKYWGEHGEIKIYE